MLHLKCNHQFWCKERYHQLGFKEYSSFLDYQLPALIPIEKNNMYPTTASLPESPSHSSENSVSPPPASYEEIPQLIYDEKLYRAQQNNDQNSHYLPPSKPFKKRRGRTRGAGPTKLPCSVCGDLAPDHMHYGGVACFSCRYVFVSFIIFNWLNMNYNMNQK